MQKGSGLSRLTVREPNPGSVVSEEYEKSVLAEVSAFVVSPRLKDIYFGAQYADGVSVDATPEEVAA